MAEVKAVEREMKNKQNGEDEGKRKNGVEQDKESEQNGQNVGTKRAEKQRETQDNVNNEDPERDQDQKKDKHHVHWEIEQNTKVKDTHTGMPQEQMEKAQDQEEKLGDLQVQAAVSTDKGSEAKLESWNSKSFTTKGDHYLCTIRRINIIYSLVGGSQQEISYVVKIKQGIPDGFNSFGDMAFEKECLMYGTIVPSLNLELQAAKDEDLRLPKCFFQSLEQGKEVVIMEDLSLGGYKMACRREGLDASHAKLVVRELARLHAASLLYQSSLPSNNLATQHPQLQRDWFNYAEEAEDELGVVLRSDINILASVAEGAGRPEEEIDWLRDLATRIMVVFSQQVASDPPFAVLCHGDCWTNNFLFRYDSEGKPEEVRLVDVQLCRRGSVALDLNTLMYSSLSGEVRRACLDSLLQEYYQSFQQVLQARDTPLSFTYEELVAEYKNKSLFGLLMGADYLPVVMVEAKDAPDFDLVKGGEEEFMKHRDQRLPETLARNPHLAPALLHLLEDMTDLGVIGTDLSHV